MERIRLILDGTNPFLLLRGRRGETSPGGDPGLARLPLAWPSWGTSHTLFRRAKLGATAVAAGALLTGCATCGLGGACGGVVAEEELPPPVVESETVEPVRVTPPPPPPKPITPPSDQTIYFDYDQSTVSMSGAALLRRHAEYLGKVAGKTVTIEGHCDDRGSKSYNLALGERRAQAVRDLLMSAGVSGSRISVISFGEESPAATGSGEDIWAKNRRAVIRYD